MFIDADKVLKWLLWATIRLILYFNALYKYNHNHNSIEIIICHNIVHNKMDLFSDFYEVQAHDLKKELLIFCKNFQVK